MKFFKSLNNNKKMILAGLASLFVINRFNYNFKSYENAIKEAREIINEIDKRG